MGARCPVFIQDHGGADTNVDSTVNNCKAYDCCLCLCICDAVAAFVATALGLCSDIVRPEVRLGCSNEVDMLFYAILLLYAMLLDAATFETQHNAVPGVASVPLVLVAVHCQRSTRLNAYCHSSGRLLL